MFGPTVGDHVRLADTELFIEVADTKARPVFLSTTAFQPVVGGATYQNVVLPAGQQPIGDPPPEIRRVAIPKHTKKPRKEIGGRGRS